MSTTLVRRQVARMWADRSISLGLALCGLGLVSGGALVWSLSQGATRTGDKMY